MLRNKVSDLTIDQLRDLIRETVQQAVKEMLADPDEDQASQVDRLVSLRDTLREQIEKELQESAAMFRSLFENSPDAIILTDIETLTIVDCNQNACKMNGFSRAELVGQPINILHQDESAKIVDDPAARQAVLDAVRRETTLTIVSFHRTRDGREVVVESSLSLVTIRGREVLMGIDRDITDRKRAERELQQVNESLAARLAEIQALQAELSEQAVHDALTGLYNRRYMDEALEREISRAQRGQSPLSLIMLDIDFFKKLNDAYGHKAGDLVLQAIGALLRQQFRQSDIVCRFGGEEFLIILSAASLQNALNRAEALCQAIASLRVPYYEQTLQVTISIGVAAFPIHGDNSDALLQAVDNALYAAKQAGRNLVRVANAHPDDHPQE